METHWDRTWRRFDEAIEQKRRRDMNETRRDALWEELNDRARTLFDTATEDLLDGVEWIKSERYDMYTMLADQLTDEAIELVTRHRDAEIRERLLSDEAVRAVSAIEISALNDSVNATKVKFGKAWDLNTDNPRAIVDLRNPYKMSIPVALDAIGLHGDGTGGQG